MNLILISIFTCLLVGCGTMKPVEGAPEVLTLDNNKVTVVVQPDGQRVVTINHGEMLNTIILLPPAKESAQDTPKVLVEKNEPDCKE